MENNIYENIKTSVAEYVKQLETVPYFFKIQKENELRDKLSILSTVNIITEKQVESIKDFVRNQVEIMCKSEIKRLDESINKMRK